MSLLGKGAELPVVDKIEAPRLETTSMGKMWISALCDLYDKEGVCTLEYKLKSCLGRAYSF